MQRSVVVLPHPLAPSSTEMAPGWNVAERASITVVVSKRFVTFSSRTVIGKRRYRMPVASCQNSISDF